MIGRVIHGKRYWMVPSIRKSNTGGLCANCVFLDDDRNGCTLIDDAPEDDKRYGDSILVGCNPLESSDDFIFIKRTKAAMAEYIAKKLDGI
jgi:hypothetical protein